MTVVSVARRRPRRILATAVAGVLLWAAAVVAGVPVAQAAAGDPVTYVGPNFGTASKPTEDKPQSKLWYADGAWWGLLVSARDGLVHVHELLPNQTWRDTGAVVDQRTNSTGDALWSGGKLYVASRHATSPLQVTRMSYDSASRSWSTDATVTVPTGGGSESATIDRDSQGRLWVTYTRNSRVWVSHTTSSGNDSSWVTPFNPGGPGADVSIASDDISALIRMPGQIGVMWSDQGSNTMWFAAHRDADPDSVWTVEKALTGPGRADDHINLKSMESDAQGRVYAAIKTSATAAGDMLLGVLVRTPQASGPGLWSVVPAFNVPSTGPTPTRPILMLDGTNKELYFFATSSESGGSIVYKKTSLDSPSFAASQAGLPFVHAAGQFINNASGSKQSASAATGLVILASDDADKLYYHGYKSLDGGTGEIDGTAPSVPGGLTATAPGPTQVDLSWSASTDNVGVTGYVVRRGGTIIAEVAGRTYSDTSVVADTSYSYTVAARDAAGNVSGQSTAATVTTPSATSGSGGTIAFGGVTTGTNTATTTLTLPKPATSAGTVLLAAVQLRGAPTITPPAGWTLVRLTPNGSSVRLATYWRLAGSAEPASYTWTFSSAQSATGSILAYNGVSPTSPIDASGGQANASSTAVTAPSITTTTANAQLVGLFANTALTSFTPPTDMTERSDVASPSTVQYKVTGSSADAVQAVAGVTGTKVATARHATVSIGQLIALRPQTGATGGGTGGGGDTTAPTAPSGLTATAPAPNRVDLAWTASTDATGVTGYVVRRGTTVLGEVTGTTFADTTVAPGTSYSYTVTARDAAGNVSGPSNTATVTTPSADTGGGTGGTGTVAFTGATTGTNTATTTLTLPTPASSTGTVLLAAVQVRGAPTITPPAGWTLVRTTASGSSFRLATYWRVVGSTEPTESTWTFSSAQTATGSILAYSGVSATNPIDASAGQANASSTAVTAPSITTTAANAQVVGLFANSGLTSFTPPSGMTERTDVASPSTVQYKVTGSSADTVLPIAGATGTKVATSTAALPSVGMLIALRPQ